MPILLELLVNWWQFYWFSVGTVNFQNSFRRWDIEAEEAVDLEAEVKQRQEAQDGGGGRGLPRTAAAVAASEMSNVPRGCDGLGRTGAAPQARTSRVTIQ